MSNTGYLYVPFIYLQLSGVSFEKTPAAVKDWTQLGRCHSKCQTMTIIQERNVTTWWICSGLHYFPSNPLNTPSCCRPLAARWCSSSLAWRWRRRQRASCMVRRSRPLEAYLKHTTWHNRVLCNWLMKSALRKLQRQQCALPWTLGHSEPLQPKAPTGSIG